MNLFMALMNTRNARTALKPDSAFFLRASPTAMPTQKMRPRLFRIETSDPERIVPKPVVTGLFMNGNVCRSWALVKMLPNAIKRPAIGRMRTGMNIALEKACIAPIAFSFMVFPLVVVVSGRIRWPAARTGCAARLAS